MSFSTSFYQITHPNWLNLIKMRVEVKSQSQVENRDKKNQDTGFPVLGKSCVDRSGLDLNMTIKARPLYLEIVIYKVLENYRPSSKKGGNDLFVGIFLCSTKIWAKAKL